MRCSDVAIAYMLQPLGIHNWIKRGGSRVKFGPVRLARHDFRRSRFARFGNKRDGLGALEGERLALLPLRAEQQVQICDLLNQGSHREFILAQKRRQNR